MSTVDVNGAALFFVDVDHSALFYLVDGRCPFYSPFLHAVINNPKYIQNWSTEISWCLSSGSSRGSSQSTKRGTRLWLRIIDLLLTCAMFQNFLKNLSSKGIEISNGVFVGGKQQHGFMKNKSTVTAGLILQSLIARALDDDCYVALAVLIWVWHLYIKTKKYHINR